MRIDRVEDLPTLTVEHTDPNGTSLRGTVSRWLWVGEGHITYLYLGKGQFLEGRFVNVSEHEGRVTFVPDEPKGVRQIRDGVQLPYLDGYWGERAAIALDPLLRWQEVVFSPRDAVKYYPGGRMETISGGWDHEHCDICWTTIDQHVNQRYMLSDQDHCICCECFTKFVQRRQIDFIFVSET